VALPINLGVLIGMAMTLQGGVDPRQAADTFASDEATLRQLRQHGDVARIARPVEVYFIGSAEAIDGLEHNLPRLGWTLVDRAPPENGTVLLTVSRTQATEPAAIRLLSEAALRIEAEYGVEYDGWETSVEGR
jgi:hypothetical protein